MRKRYLIMDRDALFTAEFRRVVDAAGVKAIRLPPRSPNLNAFAERFVLSIKSVLGSHRRRFDGAQAHDGIFGDTRAQGESATLREAEAH
jgi:transposase InsO family protein